VPDVRPLVGERRVLELVIDLFSCLTSQSQFLPMDSSYVCRTQRISTSVHFSRVFETRAKISTAPEYIFHSCRTEYFAQISLLATLNRNAIPDVGFQQRSEEGFVTGHAFRAFCVPVLYGGNTCRRVRVTLGVSAPVACGIGNGAWQRVRRAVSRLF
jgi:hypothetical protein